MDEVLELKEEVPRRRRLGRGVDDIISLFREQGLEEGW